MINCVDALLHEGKLVEASAVMGQVDGMLKELDPPPEWLLRSQEQGRGWPRRQERLVVSPSPPIPIFASLQFNFLRFSQNLPLSCVFGAMHSHKPKDNSISVIRAAMSLTLGDPLCLFFFENLFLHQIQGAADLLVAQADAVGQLVILLLQPRVFLLEPLPFARS